MKVCTKCEESKPLNGFPVNTRMLCGHDSWCLVCRNRAAAERRLRPGDAAARRAYSLGYERDCRVQNNSDRVRLNRLYEDRRTSAPGYKESQALNARVKRAAEGVQSSGLPYRPLGQTVATDGERRREIERSRRRIDLAYAAAVLAKSGRRRAAKSNATVAWANEDVILKIYQDARRVSKACNCPWHVDHIVPLQHPLVCGLHCEANLQILPSPLNLSKGNRTWPDMPI